MNHERLSTNDEFIKLFTGLCLHKPELMNLVFGW